MFQRFNVSREDALPEIEELISSNKNLYGQMRVKCASINTSGRWKNALCMIQAFKKGSLPKKVQSCRYTHALLLEGWVDKDKIIGFIKQILSGKFTVDGSDIELDSISSSFNWSFEPSGNDYDSLPGHRYELSGVKSSYLSNSAFPLIAYDLPYYLDIYKAIRKWFNFRQFYGNNDGRIGTLGIFIPDCHAWFVNLKKEEDRVIIHTGVRDKALGDKLKLKGSWLEGDRSYDFEEAVTERISIPVRDNADRFEALIIGDNEKVYDFFQETRFWIRGQGAVLRSSSEHRMPENIVQALCTGECDIVEFKPFIKIGDSKWAEIIETFIAFSNTKGGTIFFGIDDYCSVKGIEREITNLATKKSLTYDEAIDNYKGELLKQIAGNLNRKPLFDIHIVKVDGQTIMAVVIQEGEEKPYANIKTNEIFVRRGSNNVRPDPDSELSALFKHKNDKAY